jgi:hypothetical protein
MPKGKVKTMTVYLNWKGPKGRETVDQVDRADFTSAKEMRAEVRRLIGEYQLCNMAVYSSSRPCAGWSDT